MHCLANRVRVGWGSWLQVIDRIPIFSAENEVPTFEHPSVWDPSFVKLLHAVEGIYDGSTPDLSRGALYFADLRKIERDWFKTKIIQARKIDEGSGSEVPVHQRVSDMNSLSFWD